MLSWKFIVYLFHMNMWGKNYFGNILSPCSNKKFVWVNSRSERTIPAHWRQKTPNNIAATAESLGVLQQDKVPFSLQVWWLVLPDPTVGHQLSSQVSGRFSWKFSNSAFCLTSAFSCTFPSQTDVLLVHLKANAFSSSQQKWQRIVINIPEIHAKNYDQSVVSVLLVQSFGVSQCNWISRN